MTEYHHEEKATKSNLYKQVLSSYIIISIADHFAELRALTAHGGQKFSPV